MQALTRNSPRLVPNRHRGAALVVSLILLLILTIIGVTVARLQTVEERMSRNENNHQLALQAAEAALRNVENGINAYGNNWDADANGMFALIAANGSIYDQWLANTAPVGTWLSYASATNTGPPLSNVPLQAQPQYVIEHLPPAAIPSDNISVKEFGGIPKDIYRITARASGADASSNSTIQSIYRRP